MAIFATILLSISGVLSLYIGRQHLLFYQEGIIKTHKKISLKVLNEHIASEENGDNYMRLLSLKKKYIVHLVLFYIGVVMAVLSV